MVRDVSLSSVVLSDATCEARNEIFPIEMMRLFSAGLKFIQFAEDLSTSLIRQMN